MKKGARRTDISALRLVYAFTFVLILALGVFYLHFNAVTITGFTIYVPRADYYSEQLNLSINSSSIYTLKILDLRALMLLKLL